MRTRLLQEEDQKLDKAIELCKSAELVKCHANELQKSVSASASVDVIRSKNKQKHRPAPGKQTYVKKQPTKTQTQPSTSKGSLHHCTRCDTTHASMRCPAYGKTCHKCGGKNHFSKCCKSTKKIHSVNDPGDTQSDEGLYIDSVMVDSVTADWIEPLNVNGCSNQHHIGERFQTPERKAKTT